MNTITSYLDTPLTLSELYEAYKQLSKTSDPQLAMRTILPKEIINLCKGYEDSDTIYVTAKRLKKDLPTLSTNNLRAKIDIFNVKFYSDDEFNINFRFNLTSPLKADHHFSDYSARTDSSNSSNLWFNCRQNAKSALNFNQDAIPHYVKNNLFTEQMCKQFIEHARWFEEVGSDFYSVNGATTRLHLSGENLIYAFKLGISSKIGGGTERGKVLGTQIVPLEIEFRNATSFDGYIRPGENGERERIMMSGSLPSVGNLLHELSPKSSKIDLRSLSDDNDLPY